MTADPVLTLAWMVLAHIVADFVVQTTAIVAAKTSHGGRAWRGLAAHGVGVAVCLVPVALAFGAAGFWALIVITATHLAIDRTKVVATRRAEARALGDAHRRHEGRAPAAGLGRAWTPIPAAYFLLDQAAHLAISAAAWAIWLAGQAPTNEWTSAVDRFTGGRDLAAVHDVTLAAVVIAGLLIVNVRAGAIFIAILVRPLEMASDTGLDRDGGAGVPAADEDAPDDDKPASPTGWTFRVGPLAGHVKPDPPPEAPPAEGEHVLGERIDVPAPAKVGATIGVIERLLIVTFMLAGADAAIGFVIAAKTIARFRLLDDRDFAEYYLLGTLGSVAVAIVTGLVARAALQA